MRFHSAILCVVSASLLCGCRTGALSASDEQAVVVFVQKQTGEHVLSVNRRADGVVQVETDITPNDSTPRNYNTRRHYWLLKQAPDGWKLTELGTLTL